MITGPATTAYTYDQVPAVASNLRVDDLPAKQKALAGLLGLSGLLGPAATLTGAGNGVVVIVGDETPETVERWRNQARLQFGPLVRILYDLASLDDVAAGIRNLPDGSIRELIVGGHCSVGRRQLNLPVKCRVLLDSRTEHFDTDNLLKRPDIVTLLRRKLAPSAEVYIDSCLSASRYEDFKLMASILQRLTGGTGKLTSGWLNEEGEWHYTAGGDDPFKPKAKPR
jgi:hypothetical protein